MLLLFFVTLDWRNIMIGDYLLNFGQQYRYFFFEGAPNHFEVNPIIFVDQFVAHTGHTTLGNIWMLRA